MSVRVLVAGDDFVLNRLLIAALGRATTADLDIREISLPWPSVPFGRVAEVDEASGTEEQLIEALDGAEICLTQMAPLTERILASAPGLKLFGISRGGPVNANLEAATRHGVAVTYAPGRNAQATAEHTVGMILAALRRIPETHADLTAGTWRGDYYEYDRVGPELAGSTVGLVGYGAIGSLVARMLRGLGAEVIVHDPYVKPDLVEELVGLDELLSRSQIVSLHARVTAETAGMIGAAQIAALPPDAVLVNCARGSLLDYDAVCDALDSGHLYGAAFDVFPSEPIPAGSRLLSTPHVVLTPHLAGASKQTAANAARLVAADAGRYLSGQPLLHCANPRGATA
ncbi:2-hydroxyacid dehydrogenase [Actinoplanes bogorensis]|uniref:2-hydroxyacid dehydrogenase n=1 Tax=Paractinoplanes bogorensis TaxID=1610840 RepID=A0ABS5YV75_9ACTN|nr:2-hydroxyacid dehydrogenase [Actinoplanes bogorensis]MBU2667352.1 2-hydroxyacid dehydrogenase [Actinoplanes bogorensis]